MSDPRVYSQATDVETLREGTIFVCFDDDTTKLGIITKKESGDRVSGSTYWQYENGSKSDWNPHSMSSGMTVLPLACVDLGKNPLRALLCWREYYEGVR